MKRKFRRIGAALLAVALLLSAVGIAEAARPLGISLNELVKRAQQGSTRGGDNVLMADGFESMDDMIEGGGTVLGSDIPRASIGSVRFEDSLSGRGEDAWDVSAAGDGSVLAWTEPAGNLLALTIAGEGGVKLNPDSAGLFANYMYMTSFDLNGCADGGDLENLYGMFFQCFSLEELDLSGLGSSTGKDFSYMFALCSSLRRLDISGLDTGSGEDFSYMFYRVFGLKELEGRVRFPEGAVFDNIYACSTLVDGDAMLMQDSPSEDELASLSDFLAGREVAPEALGYALGSDIPRAQVRSIRFVNGLSTAPKDAWDVSRSGKGVVMAWAERNGDLYDLTLGCKHELALGPDMKYQFASYVNLEEFRIEGWIDASHVFDWDGMFLGCRKLTELDLSKFETFCARSMPRMFEGCESLRRLDIRFFDVTGATNLDSMFAGTAALEEIVTGDNFLIDEEASCEGIFDGSGYIENAPTEGGEGADDEDDADGGISIMDALGGSNRASTQMGVLRADSLDGDTAGAGGGCVLGSDLPRSAVRSIRFVAGFDGAPEDAWDVSEAGDGSVLAWAEPSGDMYDLTLAGGAGVALSDGTMLFANYNGLESIDFGGCVDTSRVSSMLMMFYNCSTLESLDLSGFDTSSVTQMNSMFFGCMALKRLDVSSFDTRSVTDMSFMFACCIAMERLDLSSFDTSSVTNASYMLLDTESLESVSISESFVLGEGANTEGFAAGSKLAEAGGSGAESAGSAAQEPATRQGEVPAENVLREFNSVPVKPNEVLGNGLYRKSQIRGVRFAGSLANASSDAWDVSAARNGAVMAWFDEASGELVIAGEGGVRLNSDTSHLFSGYPALEYVHFDGWADASDATDMSYLFCDSAKLKEVDLPCLDTSNVTDMLAMFSGCENLAALDLSGLDTSQATNMGSMFKGCSQLTALDLSGLDTSHVTAMSSMFAGCSQLTALDLSGLDTSHVTSMYDMFDSCANLTALDLSGLDTSNVTSMCGTFDGCANLRALNLSGLDTSNVMSMSCMFYGCESLTALDLSGLDTSNVTSMSSMFKGCSRLRAVDVSGFNTAKVTDMGDMFSGCESLTDLNLQSFDTGDVRIFEKMFSSCKSLETVWVSDGFVIQEYEVGVIKKIPSLRSSSKSTTSNSNSSGSGLKSLAIKKRIKQLQENMKQNQNQNQQEKTNGPSYHFPGTDQMFSECSANIIWRGQRYSNQDWISAVSIKFGMKRGDKGSSVKWLQEMLIYRGYLSTGSDDGVFGAATEKALMKFQRDHGVLDTGVADEGTLIWLRK